MKNFTLHPFDADSDLKLSGSISRSNNRLCLTYDLFDERSQVLIPAAKSPTRQNNLWQTTCFEFFLGVQNSPQYWEFNLSPSGDWNIYRFENYRTGMQEELKFTSLPFEINVKAKQVSLTIELDLNSIVQPDQPLDVSITTVIETSPQNITYWALQHCGTEADFHLRESFVLKL